eukprot:scaffold465_cov120-Isochrysis_galbana.AAC.5
MASWRACNDVAPRSDVGEVKVDKRERYTLAATRRDTSDPCRPDTPPPSSHSFPSRLLLQAAFCGGMVSELRALQQPGQESGNLKKPRLPRALGLSGAIWCGSLAVTRPLYMHSDSPSPPNPLLPPPPLAPAHVAATSQRRGGVDCVHYFSLHNRAGEKG